jgi:hypothetical protein
MGDLHWQTQSTIILQMSHSIHIDMSNEVATFEISI